MKWLIIIAIVIADLVIMAFAIRIKLKDKRKIKEMSVNIPTPYRIIIANADILTPKYVCVRYEKDGTIIVEPPQGKSS